MNSASADLTGASKRSIIPYLFFGFFGIVVLVNGVMIWLAITTFSGLETESAYIKGINYNETLAAEARQNELGWQAEIALNRDKISVELRDQDGDLLEPQSVVAKLVRPSDSSMDQTVVLNQVAAGQYSANLPPLQQGLWEVRAQIDHANERFFATDRLIVP